MMSSGLDPEDGLPVVPHLVLSQRGLDDRSLGSDSQEHKHKSRNPGTCSTVSFAPHPPKTRSGRSNIHASRSHSRVDFDVSSLFSVFPGPVRRAKICKRTESIFGTITLLPPPRYAILPGLHA